jgi:hypothetical protein
MIIEKTKRNIDKLNNIIGKIKTSKDSIISSPLLNIKKGNPVTRKIVETIKLTNIIFLKLCKE